MAFDFTVTEKTHPKLSSEMRRRLQDLIQAVHTLYTTYTTDSNPYPPITLFKGWYDGVLRNDTRHLDDVGLSVFLSSHRYAHRFYARAPLLQALSEIHSAATMPMLENKVVATDATPLVIRLNWFERPRQTPITADSHPKLSPPIRAALQQLSNVIYSYTGNVWDSITGASKLYIDFVTHTQNLSDHELIGYLRDFNTDPVFAGMLNGFSTQRAYISILTQPILECRQGMKFATRNVAGLPTAPKLKMMGRYDHRTTTVVSPAPVDEIIDSKSPNSVTSSATIRIGDICYMDLEGQRRDRETTPQYRNRMCHVAAKLYKEAKAIVPSGKPASIAICQRVPGTADGKLDPYFNAILHTKFKNWDWQYQPVSATEGSLTLVHTAAGIKATVCTLPDVKTANYQITEIRRKTPKHSGSSAELAAPAYRIINFQADEKIDPVAQLAALNRQGKADIIIGNAGQHIAEVDAQLRRHREDYVLSTHVTPSRKYLLESGHIKATNVDFVMHSAGYLRSGRELYAASQVEQLDRTKLNADFQLHYQRLNSALSARITQLEKDKLALNNSPSAKTKAFSRVSPEVTGIEAELQLARILQYRLQPQLTITSAQMSDARLVAVVSSLTEEERALFTDPIDGINAIDSLNFIRDKKELLLATYFSEPLDIKSRVRTDEIKTSAPVVTALSSAPAGSVPLLPNPADWALQQLEFKLAQVLRPPLLISDLLKEIAKLRAQWLQKKITIVQLFKVIEDKAYDLRVGAAQSKPGSAHAIAHKAFFECGTALKPIKAAYRSKPTVVDDLFGGLTRLVFGTPSRGELRVVPPLPDAAPLPNASLLPDASPLPARPVTSTGATVTTPTR